MKKLTSLYITFFLLFALYIFSFVIQRSNTDNREAFTTALVNKKNVNQINKIQLTQENKSIYLIKKGELWTLSNDQNHEFFIPANQEFINTFINELIKVRKLYKISDNLPKKNNFLLENQGFFSIKYWYGTNDFSQLIFGAEDFTKTSRYLMTVKNTKVYQIDNSLEKYFSVSTQVWAEPYIISKNICKSISPQNIQKIILKDSEKTKILTSSDSAFFTYSSKLLELRHGGISSFDITHTNPILQLLLELGDKSTVQIKVFPTDSEGELCVKLTYDLEIPTKKSYSYQVKISKWTFNSLIDIENM